MKQLSPAQAARLAQAARRGGHPLVLVDEHGRIEWCNTAAGTLFAGSTCSSSSTIGTHLLDHVAEASRREVAAALSAAHDALDARSCRRLVAGLAGTGSSVEMEVTPLPDEGGSGARSCVLVRDVSPEVERERDLVELRDRLRASFLQGSVPQAFLDNRGRFVEVNPALSDLLGVPSEALLGTSALSLVDSKDPLSRATRLPSADARGSRTARYETIVRTPHGRTLNLRVDATVLEGGAGDARGIALFVHDLTELRTAQQRLAGQRTFFEALSRQAWDLAIVSDADANLVYVSPSAVQLLGYRPEDVAQSSGFAFVHPEDRPVAERLVAEALRDPGRCSRAVLRVRHASGEWRWVEESVTNCLDDPDIGGLVANLRDVTSEVEADLALKRSEARYRAIVETAAEGILTIDSDGTVLLANERLAQLIGVTVDELRTYGVLSFLEPEQAAEVHRRLQSRAENGPDRYEVELVRPDGEHRILSVSATPLHDSEGAASLAMISDVTAERQAHERVRHRALHDPMTGLPNRAVLAERLEAAAEAARSGRPGPQLAMVYLDVDRLKQVNDQSGHALGDELLIAVAKRLQSVVRSSDTLVRLGGDEFAILCEGIQLDDAPALARRVQSAFEEPFVVGHQATTVTASIGVALSPPTPLDELLGNADTAMYQAKERQRGSYLVFDSEMAEAARRRTRLAADVRSAFEDELVLHYQPLVDLRTGRARGLEALVRWRHPRLGMLPPAELLRAAQDSGLDLHLDRVVLAMACRDMRDLIDRGLLGDDAHVAVNLSARSVVQEPIDTIVPEVLRESGLEPHHLVLEVTETAVMTDLERTAEKLRTLSLAGVRVAVDDFGTGYSSLAYLHQLPVSIVKIDRSFVSRLPGSADSLAVVKAVVGLARALDLTVVAEGIEEAAQEQLLARLGCDEGQGYLWAAGLPLGELARHLADTAAA